MQFTKELKQLEENLWKLNLRKTFEALNAIVHSRNPLCVCSKIKTFFLLILPHSIRYWEYDLFRTGVWTVF